MFDHNILSCYCMIICPNVFIHDNGVNGDINAWRIDLISIYDDYFVSIIDYVSQTD